MGFFAPWFFAGLLTAGLPLWIHLLRQHRNLPRPFASLMFFERRTQSSIKHRRLKHFLLLALRLAMILLLVLLFANPFIYRSPVYSASHKLVLIAVDHSFSMRYGDHLERARHEARNLVSRVARGDVAQIAAVSDRVELLTQPGNDRAAMDAAIASIAPGDAASSYAEFARFARALPKSSGLFVEAHFISDLQRTALPARFADLALPERGSLELDPITDPHTTNYAVESVTGPARVYGISKARLQATLWASAGTAAQAARVSLLVNNRVLDTRTANLAPSSRSEVEFQNLDIPYGVNRGELRLDAGDPLPADNHYYFSIERADPGKVLYIHDSRQPAGYFQAALESGADAAFTLDSLSTEQAVNVNLARYAYVVLSGLNSVPQNLESNLKKYVANGGGLLVALGPASTALGRVPVAGNRIVEARYSSREGERFQTAAAVDTTHPALDRSNALEGVKFFYAAKIEPGAGRVLAKLSDETPLLVEQRLGEGRVLILTSGFDNISNDLPLHALFVPFVEHLSRYLEGGETQQSNLSAGAAIELRKTANLGAAADVTGPDGKRLLSLKESAAALTIPAEREGFYDVRTASGRHELIAVNADRRESDLTPIPEETLALWRGTGGSAPVRPMGGSAPEPVPQSLWKYVLLALLAVTLVESWLADRFTPANREERPEIRKQAA